MDNFIITADILKPYFNGSKKHMCYTETVALYNSMRFHSNGETYADYLINTASYTDPNTTATNNMTSYKPANTRFAQLVLARRPNESETAQLYRQSIYVPQTKTPMGKVITSLSKIRRSADWNVDFSKVQFPARIPQEETLEQYCEKKYPGYTSITNWIFTIFLKNYCIDSNAVVAVFPMNDVTNESSFYKPVSILFNSDQVFYYEEGAPYTILLSAEKSDLKDKYGAIINYQQGKVFYVLSATEFIRYEQADLDQNYTSTRYIKHDLGYIPVFKVPGKFLAQKNNTIMQESPLSPMLPELDEAVREYSDLQAVKVMHMYPLLWYYDNKECNNCNGTGKVLLPNGTAPTACTKCNATGKIQFSPFKSIAVEPPNTTKGETTVPTPPAGYVVRDSAIIDMQEKSVDKHKFTALSSVNMQFLDQTPLSISGDAKNVDREELNNFVYNIAEDIVDAMDQIYIMINDWRYSFSIADTEQRNLMLPGIAVPQNFDLLPTDYLIDDIVKGKNNRVNPVLMAAMETQYANKMFYTDSSIASMIALTYNLDPLPGLTDDEKMVRLSNKGVSQIDYIISSNIVAFVKDALQGDDQFQALDYEDQMEKMIEMANTKQKQISAADKLLPPVALPIAPAPIPVQV